MEREKNKRKQELKNIELFETLKKRKQELGISMEESIESVTFSHLNESNSNLSLGKKKNEFKRKKKIIILKCRTNSRITMDRGYL
jgi:hypothetical protein